MTSSVKSIGIIVMTIGLLGLTSGCGKKLTRGSSELAHESNEPSMETVSLTEKIAGFQPLASLDEVRLREETDSGVDKSSRGSQANYQSSIVQGMSDLTVSDPHLKKGLDTETTLKMPSQKNSAASGQQLRQKGVTFSSGLQDIYFQFDSWRISEKSRRVLEVNAEWLKAHPHERITIEGHCDERGTQAYNYVLGEKRASMVQQYLGFLGVSHRQLAVMSFGKDKPKCHVYSENCFRKNRRAHFGSDLNLASQ